MVRRTILAAVAAVVLAAVVCGAALSSAAAQEASPKARGAGAGSTIDGTIQGTSQGTVQGKIPGAPNESSGQTTAPPSVPGLQGGGSGGYRIISPVVQPALKPGEVELLELEGRFSQAVAEGGGKAFGQWFADDAVVLNNGKPAVLGRGAIAAQAQWDAKQYKLTWVAQGAQMGPSNDMGFTWGHYEGRTIDAKGETVSSSGRYMTVWKKTRESGWKVAMDASATEPPNAGECCVLVKP